MPFEKIYRFLTGDMRIEESAQVQEEAARDSILAAEIDQARSILLGIDHYGDTLLRQALQKAEIAAKEKGYLLTEEDIRLHFQGRLPEDLERLMDRRLEEDPEFGEVYAFEKQLFSGIAAYEREALRKTMESASDRLEKEGFFEEISAKKVRNAQEIRRLSPVKAIWAFAAAAAVLVLAGLWLFQIRPAQKNQQMMALFEIPKEETFRTLDYLEHVGMGSADQMQRQGLARIVAGMAHAPLEEVAQWLAKHVEEYPQDVYAMYYQGIVWRKLKQPELAAQKLEMALPLAGPDLRDGIRFQLAGALSVIPERREEALMLLQEMANENTPYAVNAQNALQLLRH